MANVEYKRVSLTRRRGNAEGECRAKSTTGILYLLALLFLPIIAYAGQKPDAGQPGYFLKLATDARILSMGKAGVACSDSGIFINPAGIAVAEAKKLQLTTIALPFPDTSCNFLSYTQSMGTEWGIGLGVPILKVTGAEKHMGEYESSGTFDDKYIAFGLGLARSFSPGFSVGLTLKIMQQRFDEKTSQGNDVDIGLLYQHKLPSFSSRGSGGSSVSLGASLQNILGSIVKQMVGIDKMPQTIKAGIGYHLLDRALLTVDMEKPSGRSLKLHLGGEYSPIEPLSLRVGYDDQGYLTAGVGLKLQDFTLDYGLQNHSYKLSHRVSVGVRFGE